MSQTQTERAGGSDTAALRGLRQHLAELNALNDTYDHVENTLETLPRRLTQPAMIPIGQVAFMPGKLVNTNEIMVYLGGELFAKRSAFQAREIINRRRTGNEESIQQVEELLGERTHTAKKNAKTRSSEIQQLLQERKEEGIQEIKEPLQGPGSEQEFLQQSPSDVPAHDSFKEPVDPAEVERISKTLERLEMLERMESTDGAEQAQSTGAHPTQTSEVKETNTESSKRGTNSSRNTRSAGEGAFSGVVQERPTPGFTQEQTEVREVEKTPVAPPRQSRFKQQQMKGGN